MKIVMIFYFIFATQFTYASTRDESCDLLEKLFFETGKNLSNIEFARSEAIQSVANFLVELNGKDIRLPFRFR
jgi:hypothetical protein